MRTVLLFLVSLGLLALVIVLNREVLWDFCLLNPELVRLTTLVLCTLVLLGLVSSLHRRKP